MPAPWLLRLGWGALVPPQPQLTRCPVEAKQEAGTAGGGVGWGEHPAAARLQTHLGFSELRPSPISQFCLLHEAFPLPPWSTAPLNHRAADTQRLPQENTYRLG